MRKLSLSLLTAGAVVASGAAFAQAGHGGHGGPPPGATWHMGSGGGVVGPPARGPNMGGRGGVLGPPAMGPNLGGHGNMGGNRTYVRTGGGYVYGGGGGGGGGGGAYGGGGSFHGGGMHGGGNYPHRLQRGYFVPPFWFGNQFYINNWQGYGFYAPGEDQRWIRYYDDAYLIDRGGRIIDSREGLDWDRYGDDWDMEDGIPAYRGSRDYVPDEDDYAWNDRHGGGRDMREMHVEMREDGDHHRGHHGEMRVEREMVGPYGPPMGGPGYGYAYGGGYGYGYGAYAYPIVIETITTGGGATITEEVTETVYETRARVHRRPHCSCAPRRAPPRRPPPGERG